MFNNNLKRNHAKHETCNTVIKQTSMASSTEAPTNYRRRRSDHQNPAAAMSTNSLGYSSLVPRSLPLLGIYFF